MIRQYRFKLLLDAIQQQAISQANAGYCYVTLFRHN